MADPVAEVLAQVAAVLAEHRRLIGWNGPGGVLWQFAQCAAEGCGFVCPDPATDAFAAHQADALRAKGLVVSEREWGVQSPDSPDEVIVAANDEEARRIALPGRHDPRLWPVVTRGVTPWRTADEGSES